MDDGRGSHLGMGVVEGEGRAGRLATGLDMRSTARLFLKRWAGFVVGFHSERALSPGDPGAAGMGRWFEALHNRDALEDALRQLEAGAANGLIAGWSARQSALVVAVDALFDSFTEPDTERLLPLVRRPPEGAGPWWARVPVTGPVRAELRQHAAQHSDGPSDKP